MTYSAFSPLCASVSHRIGCFLPDFFSLFFFSSVMGQLHLFPLRMYLSGRVAAEQVRLHWSVLLIAVGVCPVAIQLPVKYCP